MNIGFSTSLPPVSPTMSRTLSLLLAGLALGACKSRSSQPPQVTTRDSAGISIVENSADPGEVPEWRLAQEAELEIGTVDGDPAYLLHLVGNIVELADGGLLVPVGQREFRRYDRDGRHLWTAGRAGEGPGEFRQLWTLLVIGDTILAHDVANRRVSHFGMDGSYLRTHPFQEPFIIGQQPDGSLLMVRTAGRTGAFDPGYGYFADSLVALRLSHPESVPDTILAFAGSTPQPASLSSRPMSPVLSMATDGRHILVGDASRYEIRIHDLTGRLVRVVRRLEPAEEVTEEVIEAHEAATSPRRSREMAEISPSGETYRPPPVTYPETLPFFRGIKADSAGNLWVRRYELEGDTIQDWDIYDPHGRLHARMHVPVRFRIRRFGPDYLVVVHTDELDVQTVRRYRLTTD